MTLHNKSSISENVSLIDSDDDGAGPSSLINDEAGPSTSRDDEDGNELVEGEAATPTPIVNESRKKKKPKRSYGAALLDFSEDFMNRFKQANNEFLEGMRELQEQQQQFDREAMEADRNFIRQLFQDH